MYVCQWNLETPFGKQSEALAVMKKCGQDKFAHSDFGRAKGGRVMVGHVGVTPSAIVDEFKIFGRQYRIGTFKSEHRSTREHVLRKRFLQKLIRAHAREAFGDEADVVILRLRVPGRRNDAERDADDQPGGKHDPRLVGREMSQTIEHARSILREGRSLLDVRENRHAD